MQRVIYADVLVIINVYITYFLLKSTALLVKKNPDRLRLFISSLLGGFYSLTVLLPEKIQGALVLLRLATAILFVFIAFGYTSFKAFLRLNLSFLFCSFVFAGLMLALWYFICPAGMYFNGSVAYFDIDILTLVVLTIFCYCFMKLYEKLFRTRAPVNTVFYCKVDFEGMEFNLKAFLDTGNNLKDYFTGKPVVVANRNAFKKLFPDALELGRNERSEKIRYIFCDTVGGEGLLPAFSPFNMHIKGVDYDFSTAAVTVALTEKKLFHGEYDAILPLGLFDNKLYREDEGESENTYVEAEAVESTAF
ncbi:MAG: sigma-E processing peptidase SpoIIGA [Clostridia bacterium]|nr:sigma-E processing peptidase SpoIIGA [Clostridia bacterium]